MICLSFDIEEFDMPLEYGKKIALEEQLKISQEGTKIILDILKKYSLKATFFSTVIFAENSPEIIQRIIEEGHELGSHTYYHSQFSPEDLLNSRTKLEELSGQKILGLRMPRMQSISSDLVQDAGYQYNSSLNPTFLPGRYNHLTKPRKKFKSQNLLNIPSSVSPIFRIPMFWLSFHNFPLPFFQYLSRLILWTDGYLVLYFHPWEFTDLTNVEKFGFPKFVSKNSGIQMVRRFNQYLEKMLSDGKTFSLMKELL